MTQDILFLGRAPEGRSIYTFHFGLHRPVFAFLNAEGEWVPDYFCGRFPDGFPRPPWCDVLFFRLWNDEGPDAARDKHRYTLCDTIDCPEWIVACEVAA